MLFLNQYFTPNRIPILAMPAQVEKYTFDTCNQDEHDAADLSVEACCLGSAASMINDAHGFRNPDGSAACANAKFERVNVQGVPVVVVRAIADIAAGECVLLDYHLSEATRVMGAAKRRAQEAANAFRQAKLSLQFVEEQWRDRADTEHLSSWDCLYKASASLPDAELPYR
jgi:hypothetical protein